MNMNKLLISLMIILTIPIYTNAVLAESNGWIRDESLKGRGMSDGGREEPQYINIIGYVVISSDEEYTIRRTDKFDNENLWVIPTYEKDKQFWNKVRGVTIPHKTEVVVLEQYLEHHGYGAYGGFLLVERLDTHEQYYINAMNFITKPYWTFTDDLELLASEGYCVAVYRQISNYYPILKDGEKANIEDGKIVLITGKTGLMSKVDDETNGIKAEVWQQWRYGYGDVSVYFNSDDLTILY